MDIAIIPTINDSRNANTASNLFNNKITPGSHLFARLNADDAPDWFVSQLRNRVDRSRTVIRTVKTFVSQTGIFQRYLLGIGTNHRRTPGIDIQLAAGREI